MEKTATMKPSRIASATLFTALIFTLIFSSLVSAAHVPICVETTKDNLNIRMEPDTYSEILTVVEKQGTTLYPVGKVSDNWYKVEFSNGYVNGVYGYVFKDYVVESGALRSSVTLLPGAALRTQPYDTASVQKMCSTGTELTITGVDATGNWYYATAFNGEKGYIKKSSVEALDITDYPIAKRTLAEVEDISIVMMNSDGGKIRSSASTGSGILATVDRGALLSVVDEIKGQDNFTWYKVYYDAGKTGYVRSDIVKSYSTSHLAGKTIVIDPGHGSYTNAANLASGIFDNGNIGVSGSKEKDMNLPIARYLQAYLAKAGANAILTRETDVGLLSLTYRGEIANMENADIFVSIHINYSSKDPDKQGIVTYYWSESGTGSRDLAAALQSASVFELGAEDLGIGEERFTVLTASRMDSAMVELGFMSNAEEEALLLKDSYQMLCAQGVFKGILKHFE